MSVSVRPGSSSEPFNSLLLRQNIFIEVKPFQEMLFNLNIARKIHSICTRSDRITSNQLILYQNSLEKYILYLPNLTGSLLIN